MLFSIFLTDHVEDYEFHHPIHCSRHKKKFKRFLSSQGYLELRDVKPRDQRFFSPSIVGLPATDRKTCLLVSGSTWQCVLVVR